jgi:hypothetical protein
MSIYQNNLSSALCAFAIIFELLRSARGSTSQLDTSLTGFSNREAAAACSPRRKPGGLSIIKIQAAIAVTENLNVCRHIRGLILLCQLPQAYAQCRQNKGIYMMARMSRSIDLRRVNICSHIDEEQSN